MNARTLEVRTAIWWLGSDCAAIGSTRRLVVTRVALQQVAEGPRPLNVSCMNNVIAVV